MAVGTTLTPPQVLDYVEQVTHGKARLDTPRMFTAAIMGGLFLGFGGLLSVVITSNLAGITASDPGLQKLLFGLLFPLGLTAVVLTGVDLFTSNCATFVVPLRRRSLPPASAGRVLVLSYFGNFVGSLLAAAMFGIATGLLDPGTPAQAGLFALADAKLHHTFIETFFRGIAANTLVCLAIWQAYAAKDVISKVVGIWIPVSAFVALGMEHSIANMFFLPAALMAGYDTSWAAITVDNLVPATLGNLVGGAIFIGLAMSWLHDRGDGRAAMATAAAAALPGTASSTTD